MFKKEADLCRYIKKRISLSGGIAYKIRGDRYQEPGIPDLLCCYNGQFIGIECKLEYNNTSPTQDYQLNAISKSGGKAYVIYPHNVDDILNEILNEKN